ncbi:DUF3306 domain-containing protein [Tropicibacter sp. S64]|uniref:DUF3306 domain-containing protein n=1 Tax=Tropicibacter sp. S64 TaxID=3415122 RepID=UPI003C7B6D77
MAEGFWARRKAAVEAEAKADAEAVALREQAAREQALQDRPDEELLAELGLPEPEAVDDPDLIKRFLTEQLPQRLKRRALRRLWTLNPVLANLDGLNDYDDDYTTPAGGFPPVQTVYQVGKGMLAHLLDETGETGQSAQILGEVPAKREEAEEPPAEADRIPESSVADTAPRSPDGDADVPEAVAEADHEPARTARRMRFRFDAPETT